MGIDLPDLDDREYEELLEQAKKLIPAYSENWTDFNPHDPGMTILEILAWLTETHTYQLDQVTDEHREKYLRLIGHRPQPPSPASTPIELSVPASVSGKRLPAGSRFAVTDGAENRFQFETDRDLVVTAASIDRVLTLDATGVSDQTEANQTDEMFYLPLGETASAGNTLYLGFDDDPFGGTDSLSLWVGFHDDNLPEPNPDPDGTFRPSVDLAWEYYDPEAECWQGLTVIGDNTNTFYEGGLIEFERGEETVGQQWGPVGEVATDGHWVRCRVETEGYEIPPQFDRVTTNVVTASHRVTVTDEQLQPAGGDTNSHRAPLLDGQAYEFAEQPVLSATVTVDGVEFTEVPDFDASGPDDPHYVLDRERGTVTFGDGETGYAPPPEATVTASYVYGGGTEGNVSAAATWRCIDSAPQFPLGEIEVAAGAASGGADGESVTEALQRARRDLRRPYRAVTEDDYQYLAAHTPGLRIGRTNIWIDDGHTTVVVVPYAPPAVRSPRPSDAFLDRVRTHLREHTLVTDRMTVSGPRYVRLEISVSGAIRSQYARSGYESAVADAIESYLHPLYGYDGDGWPFGRAVTDEELAEEIEAVDAVDHISGIKITAHGGTTIGNRRVEIDETALFSIEEVTVDMTVTGGK